MCGVCFCGDTTGDEDDMCAELRDFLWDYHKGGVCYTLREHQKVIDEVKSAQRTESRRLYASLEYKM